MKRVSEKGKPDFSMFNYQEATDMRLMINKLMGSYCEFPDKVSLLSEMWKELSDYCADEVVQLPEKEVTGTRHKFRRVFARKK